jgi:hypothetical protein
VLCLLPKGPAIVLFYYRKAPQLFFCLLTKGPAIILILITEGPRNNSCYRRAPQAFLCMSGISWVSRATRAPQSLLSLFRRAPQSFLCLLPKGPAIIFLLPKDPTIILFFITKGPRNHSKAYLPKGPASVLVYVGNLVGEQGDKGRNAAQLPRFRLHRVVHVAEVLQVRRCVGLQNKGIVSRDE